MNIGAQVVDALRVDAIRRRLSPGTMWRGICLFGEVASTNQMLACLARSGAGEGTVVLADAQREARGRLGQPWFSPPGVNLYVSALFRDCLSPADAPLFSFIASLAVADAVRELGQTPAIKWPNDVLLGRKKVAGALVECAIRGDAVDYLVVGVGVNVNVSPESLRAALGPAGAFASSLAVALGRPVDRNALAASYLAALEMWAHVFRQEGAAPVLAAWRDRDILTGRHVEAVGRDERFDGRVLGVDLSGHLVIKLLSGEAREVLNEQIRTLD